MANRPRWKCKPNQAHPSTHYPRPTLSADELPRRASLHWRGIRRFEIRIGILAARAKVARKGKSNLTHRDRFANVAILGVLQWLCGSGGRDPLQLPVQP